MSCARADEALEKAIEGYVEAACFGGPFVVRNPIVELVEDLVARPFRGSVSKRPLDGFEFRWRNDGVVHGIVAVFNRGTDELVGGYRGRDLFVHPDFRGRGVGPEILVLAFETGVVHPSTMNVANNLTKAGRANRRRAHILAVRRALADGIHVPDVVLAAYPDLCSSASACRRGPSGPSATHPETIRER